MIDSVTNIRPGKEIPSHLLNLNAQKNGTEFDVNDYFTVLDMVRVKLVIFTEFGGFPEFEYFLAADFPHTVIDFNYSVLVAYDSGRMY